MTKKERIAAAVRGDTVDQVPSGFWFHFPEHQFYGEPAVSAHLDFLSRTDVDLLKVMNEYQLRFDREVTDASDWRKIRPLSPHDSMYRGQLDIIKAVADAVGDEVPIIATIHGVFASAFHASRRPGESFSRSIRLMDHLLGAPSDAAAGMRVVSGTLTELGLACLDAGADGIYYAALGGEEYRFTRQQFDELVMPHDMAVLSALGDATDLLCLHICKDRVRLPQYWGYPADVVNWAVHDSEYPLRKGRELFDAAILGGLDDRAGVMVDGAPPEVRDEVQRIVADFGTRKFILGCDCTLPTDVRLENVRAAVDAAREMTEHP